MFFHVPTLSAYQLRLWTGSVPVLPMRRGSDSRNSAKRCILLPRLIPLLISRSSAGPLTIFFLIPALSSSDFKPVIMEICARSGKEIELGIRINPEHSEGAVEMYDPCAPGSRLGIRRAQLQENLLEGVSGLHWHNLCEQDADCLERTVTAVEERFGDLIPQMNYVNFGGGHHITRPGYDLERLIRVINDFKAKWGVQVYLEPGEAVALNCGYLVSTVLDVTRADMDVAIIDGSVPAHMPDVLEMPYRPHIIGSGEAGEKAHSYRIGGLSCLAGDVAGIYSFDQPLAVGDRLVFSDMAIYTMVKNNTFNGVGLPSIYLYEPEDDNYECVRSFGYEDFKNRLS